MPLLQNKWQRQRRVIAIASLPANPRPRPSAAPVGSARPLRPSAAPVGRTCPLRPSDTPGRRARPCPRQSTSAPVHRAWPPRSATEPVRCARPPRPTLSPPVPAFHPSSSAPALDRTDNALVVFIKFALIDNKKTTYCGPRHCARPLSSLQSSSSLPPVIVRRARELQ